VSVIPSPWPVCHIARRISTDPADEDEHGYYPIVDQPPVIRFVMSITQFGRRGSTHEVISPEYLLRTETTLLMAVADPTPYQPEDLVLVNPQLDMNGQYVTDTGTAYWMDGVAADERQGPWPDLLAAFGALLRLRRVT
jgi:hypothetical protein